MHCHDAVLKCQSLQGGYGFMFLHPHQNKTSRLIQFLYKRGMNKCCLPRKIQNFDTQNPKFQQPVETVENFKIFVQLKQNKLI